MDRWREGRDAFLDKGQRVKSPGNQGNHARVCFVDTLEREMTAVARARRVSARAEVRGGYNARLQKLSQVRAGRGAGCR